MPDLFNRNNMSLADLMRARTPLAAHKPSRMQQMAPMAGQMTMAQLLARRAGPPTPPPGQYNIPQGGMPRGLFAPVSMGAANPAVLPFRLPAQLPRAQINPQRPPTPEELAAADAEKRAVARGMTVDQAKAIDMQALRRMQRGAMGPGAGQGMGGV